MRRHLGFTKLCKQWDKLPINWCRISAINSSRSVLYYVSLANRHFTTSSVRPQDCLISKPMNFDQFLVSWKKHRFFRRGNKTQCLHDEITGKSLSFNTGVYESLVGSFNPFEKYESKWVHLPQIGVNIKNSLKPPPTPLKFNMEPENGPPGKGDPF